MWGTHPPSSCPEWTPAMTACPVWCVISETVVAGAGVSASLRQRSFRGDVGPLDRKRHEPTVDGRRRPAPRDDDDRASPAALWHRVPARRASHARRRRAGRRRRFDVVVHAAGVALLGRLVERIHLRRLRRRRPAAPGAGACPPLACHLRQLGPARHERVRHPRRGQLRRDRSVGDGGRSAADEEQCRADPVRRHRPRSDGGRRADRPRTRPTSRRPTAGQVVSPPWGDCPQGGDPRQI